MYTQSVGNKGKDITQIMNITNVEQKPLVPTVIFELLSFVYSFKFDNDSDFSLKEPAELKKKLQFNHSKKYIWIFEQSIDDYFNLDKVLKNEFIKSEKVIENIKFLFWKACECNDDGIRVVSDGDACLDKMHKDIKNRIINDPKYQSSGIDDFDIDKFIIALLQYGVIKCQILLNPNEYEEVKNVASG
ncbi:hypothetical protein [Streptococcus pluranimalium]|uniref:hypothetical protein n=1 Tax=Streptococcus pluranimalium TaxID=82348 RepID=UPI0039FC0D4A